MVLDLCADWMFLHASCVQLSRASSVPFPALTRCADRLPPLPLFLLLLLSVSMSSAAAASAPAVGTVASDPQRPLVASYLNDSAALHTPLGATFTSYHCVRLAVSPDAAFEQLCMPTHAHEVVLAHTQSCDFTALPASESLEVSGKDGCADYSDSAGLGALVTSHGDWPHALHYSFVLRCPLLFGLWTKRVAVRGVQVADPANRFLRYACNADDGQTQEFKYRWITPAGDEKEMGGPSADEASASAQPKPESCLVHEYVVGAIKTKLFRGYAESQCRSQSASHMAKYAGLKFER